MKLQSYVNEDGQIKIQLQRKGYTLDGFTGICRDMGLYEDALFKIFQTNGAIFGHLSYGFGYDHSKYHFPTQEMADATLAILNPILDAYQAQEKQKAQIKKEIAKGKDANVFILETTNLSANTKKITIGATIGLTKKSAIFDLYGDGSGSITNSYYVCRLPRSYTKEIIKEFNKCEFDDFVDAILKVREIADPYIIMQKITN